MVDERSNPVRTRLLPEILPGGLAVTDLSQIMETAGAQVCTEAAEKKFHSMTKHLPWMGKSQ